MIFPVVNIVGPTVHPRPMARRRSTAEYSASLPTSLTAVKPAINRARAWFAPRSARRPLLSLR